MNKNFRRYILFPVLVLSYVALEAKLCDPTRTLTKQKILNLEAKRSFVTQVHGHRGARARFPENTIVAFSYALNLQADALELDVAFTKELIPIIIHDLEINPEICLEHDGSELKKRYIVFETSLEHIKSFDCGSKQHPSFPHQRTSKGEKIPTLEELLAYLRSHPSPHSKKVILNIETKSDPTRPDHTPSPSTIISILHNLFEKYNVSDRVIIQSFDFRTLVESRKLNPKIPISALTGLRFNDFEELFNLNPDIISPNYLSLNHHLIKQAHTKGIKVIPYTINREDDWERFIGLDVDGIITDDPEGLISYLETSK